MSSGAPASLARTLASATSKRQVHGISAVLLPFSREGSIDWQAFERLVHNTYRAGLDLAVNMDTGFGDLLTAEEREQILDAVRGVLGDAPFYAGAYPKQDSDDPIPSYHESIAAIAKRGAVPVIVQWRGMHGLTARAKADLYRRIVAPVDRAIAFELGPMFAPHGEIWDDETFERVLEVPAIVGAKHSSLDRSIELRRLETRTKNRPDFRVYTGNDLAIDMVLYGSDYLLGLSAFCPAKFAERDRALRDDELGFLAVNDALQYLGNVGFRTPVPAYKHSAAMFLHLTGLLEHDAIHPKAQRRPASDRIVLYDCALRLGLLDDPQRVYRERVETLL